MSGIINNLYLYSTWPVQVQAKSALTFNTIASAWYNLNNIVAYGVFLFVSLILNQLTKNIGN